MILRHLANSFRKQDWFTVVLEVLIVVVGIFIGLQVDDWNQARKEKNQEQEIIASLRVEVNNNIAAYEATRLSLDAEQAMLRGYYDYLTGTNNVQPDQLDLLGVLCRVGLGRDTTYDNTIYEELISTGRTAIISKDAVRAALRQYKRIQEDRKAAFEDVVLVAIDQYAAIQEFLEWRPFAVDNSYVDCDFHFADFEADQRAPHNIAGAQRIFFFYMIGTEWVLQSLFELRAALDSGYPPSEGVAQ